MENTLITRESVKAEIDLIQEQYLEVLYKIIKSLQPPQNFRPLSLTSKLKTVAPSKPSSSKLEELVAKMPNDYETIEENWGQPIGKEVW